MGDQRRSSWPWRRLKSSSSTLKAGDKANHLSPSHLSSPASSFKAEESARFLENLRQEATSSTLAANGRIAEAVALREQAEESLRALRQELNTVMKELISKEALVKQHQKVADEAVSGWENAEKEALSFKQELESAAQQRIILEDRVTQLDGALKECMRQVRHVRDEQAGKIQEAIACNNRDWEVVKAEMDTRQAELQRRLMESDAQNSAMAKSLQERARRIVEANEAKSKAETEMKVLQVKLGSYEKDISALQYELHLLSKELEIRNEEVAYCKKSADMAHKQHLEQVQKVAKLEADCQRLRILVKKKLPGPAAITQMRKEVEGLQGSRSTSSTAEVRRRPDRLYASSTISFTNSHQRGITASINRDVEILQDRLFSVEAENKLLKEALSKRIGELQASWLLCAKTANKLSIAEDQLESLQGTPREARMNGFDFNFTTTTTEPSIASVSDENGFGGNEEEASCAESWASALIGELAHIKKEKVTTQEAIKEDAESDNINAALPNLEKVSVLHTNEVVIGEKKCLVNDPLPDSETEKLVLEMGNQDVQLQALSSLCKDLDHKLGAIEEQLRSAGKKSEDREYSVLSSSQVKESVIGLVDAAHQKFSELERTIQGMGSISMQPIPDDVVGNAAPASTSISEGNESRQGLATLTPMESVIPSTASVSEKEELGLVDEPVLVPTSISEENEPKMSALSVEDTHVKASDSIPEQSAIPSHACSLSFVLCKLIALLDMLPRKPGDATLDAGCTGGKREGETHQQWDQEKQALVACKDSFLQGKSSVLEFLVRLGVVVCRAVCHGAGSRELEAVLNTLNAEVEPQVHVDAAGFLTGHESMPRQCQEASRLDELEADVAGGECEESKELVNQLKSQLAELEREKEKLQSELEEVEREREKLCGERERLSEEGAMKATILEEAQAEVAHYKLLHTELETKCQELHLKVQGFELVEAADCNAVKLSDVGEDTCKLKKQGELVDAKEKLAECERSIMVLGKQLNALSSVNQPELTQPSHTNNHAYSSSLPHHHHPRHQYQPEPHPHYADVYQPQREIYAFDAAEDQPPPRGWSSRHVISGPQECHRVFRQSGAVDVAQSQQRKAPHHQRCVEAADWPQHEEEGGQYSPPLSAMSSPARSPARYMQQVSGRATSGRATVVRTSLTQSMNAAARSTKVKPRAPAGAASGTSFGRLFSRSKNNR